ncbi:putative protein ariadne-2 [Cytospora mali]|uniref:RBR-type E3 ubiquitin transferase n=1 Tax=Cytospora mali TaxID=578113 RepID=A0A194V0C0_CYTMA|nr:putative protein ariadne-2 [Valsa mali var. pyri (nom. inval.)]
MQPHVEQITAEASAYGFPPPAADNDETETNNEDTMGTDTIDNYKLDRDHNKAEKDAHAAFITDPAMTESIATAVHEDHNVVAAIQVQDNRTVDGLNDSPPHLPYKDSIDNEFIHELEARWNIVPEYNSEVDTKPHTGSSSTAASRAQPFQRAGQTGVCVVCDDNHPLFELAKLPCSHGYCGNCLERLVANTLTDEALWPPRCCRQPIPADEPHIQVLLSEQIMAQYLTRKVEMETPNRTYCYKPECSKFIPPRGIEHDTATCPACEAKTCVICKGVAHVGCDCPHDEAGQQLKALADGEGWKQCFSCNSIVELVYGCIHIKCRCGAEFCYKCGAGWDPRTCKCELFAAEDLLYQFARANEHPDEPLAEHLEWDMEIGEFQAVEMMQNEECPHRRWRHRGGPAECGLCGMTMRGWINVCRQCNMTACARCRFHHP